MYLLSDWPDGPIYTVIPFFFFGEGISVLQLFGSVMEIDLVNLNIHQDPKVF